MPAAATAVMSRPADGPNGGVYEAGLTFRAELATQWQQPRWSGSTTTQGRKRISTTPIRSLVSANDPGTGPELFVVDGPGRSLHDCHVPTP